MPLVEEDHKCKECRLAFAAGLPDAPKRVRAAPYPGPRCTTHQRERRKAVKAARQEAHQARTYELGPGEYRKLYDAQGGRCAGCRRARGTGRRALATDHDHNCTAGHPRTVGCRKCVRGLLCSTCNRILGHFMDDPVALFRLGLYLIDPPARHVLGDGVPS